MSEFGRNEPEGTGDRDGRGEQPRGEAQRDASESRQNGAGGESGQRRQDDRGRDRQQRSSGDRGRGGQARSHDSRAQQGRGDSRGADSRGGTGQRQQRPDRKGGSPGARSKPDGRPGSDQRRRPERGESDYRKREQGPQKPRSGAPRSDRTSGDKPGYGKPRHDRPGQDRTGQEKPEQARPERVPAPELPEGADFEALDGEARRELRGLPKTLAETIGKHLVAAGLLIDEQPEQALVHARYARDRASRVPLVREAAGLSAYHAGEWAEAISELRAVRRMSGSQSHVAVLADCERALGRPERAIELAREADPASLDPETAAELKIVAAGARRDMGELDAAVVSLQGKDLDPNVRYPWSARLFYAYADNLVAAGRADEAVEWFMHAADADEDGETDAAERAMELGEAEPE